MASGIRVKVSTDDYTPDPKCKAKCVSFPHWNALYIVEFINKNTRAACNSRVYDQPVQEVDMDKVPQKSGIYKIVNVLNNFCYVGSAVNLSKRHSGHVRKLDSNKHENQKLQNAWNKYGSGSFEFVVIEFCHPDELLVREQYYLDTLETCDRDKGYNIYPTAGSAYGYKHTPEALEKIRYSSANPSPETRAKLHEAQSNRSPEWQENIRASRQSPENRERLRQWHANMSDEERRDYRERQLVGVRNRTEASIENIRKAARNRGDEWRANVRQSNALRKSATWEITFPDGTIEHIRNLNAFCLEHGISVAIMRNIADGLKKNSYGGWYCRKIENGGT